MVPQAGHHRAAGSLTVGHEDVRQPKTGRTETKKSQATIALALFRTNADHSRFMVVPRDGPMPRCLRTFARNVDAELEAQLIGDSLFTPGAALA